MRIRTSRFPSWPSATVLACAAVLAGPAASAQVEEPRSEFCWRGRPAPACGAFLVAEGNLYTVVAGSRYTRLDYDRRTTTRSLELTGYAAWELGAMVNLDSANAAGVSVLLGGDANGFRWALKGRYRRWIGAASALDVGAGVLGAGRSVPNAPAPGNHHVPAAGLTGDVSLGHPDWASLGVRADLLFSGGGEGPATAYYVGTRLGTRPALAATAAPFLLAAVIFMVVGTGSP